MKKLSLALLATTAGIVLGSLLPQFAIPQGGGVYPNHEVLIGRGPGAVGFGTIPASSTPGQVLTSVVGGDPVWSAGGGSVSTLGQNHIYMGNAANTPVDSAVGGDCTGSLIVTTATLRCVGTATSGQILLNSSGAIAGATALPAANFPALTGDVTTPGASLATTLANIPSATPMAGSLLASAIAAPGLPGAGKAFIYVDSTTKALASKDDAGFVHTTVVADPGSSNNFLTGISTAGIISKAQPAFTNLSGTLGCTQHPALTGDVTTTNCAATIANQAVTYAKIQNISATQRVLGRNTAGAGVTEEVTASQLHDWIGNTRGSILYRGAAGWAILAPGAINTVLTSQGAGADPIYNAVGTGTVTKVQCGGANITTTGSCSSNNIAARAGAFDVWQENTIFNQAASQTAYTADGWYLITNANQASTVQRGTPGSAIGSAYFAAISRNAGQTGTGVMRFAMPLDTDEIAQMQGSFIALSFTAGGAANWSPASGTLNYAVYCGTGAVAKRGAVAYTGETTPISSSVNLTPGASSTRFSTTSAGTVSTTCTQAEIQFNWTPVGTAGAADQLVLDDLQLEVVAEAASAASPFKRIPFQQQLALAQRFYQKSFSYGVAVAQNSGSLTGAVTYRSQSAGTTVAYDVHVRFPVVMRTVPTVTFYNPNAANGNWRNTSTGADSGTGTTSSAGDGGFTTFNAQAAGDAVNQTIQVHYAADSRI